MTITVGTTVNVKNRTDLTQRWGFNTELRHYGIVIELLGEDRALVRLRFPKKHSGKCPHCGSTYRSVNGSGEISCDDGWGCGRGFGFDEREEVIPLDKLINMDEVWLRKARMKFLKDIQGGLMRTLEHCSWSIWSSWDIDKSLDLNNSDPILTEEEQKQVLDFVGNLLHL